MDRETMMKLLDVAPKAVKAAPGPRPTTTAEFQPDSDTPASESALVLDKWDLARGAGALERSPRAKTAKLTATEMADFYTAAWSGDPQKAENCVNEDLREYMDALLAAPETQSLRASTTYNALASEMAATQFALPYAEIKNKKPQLPPKGRAETAEEAEQKKASQRMRAVGKAIKAAEKEVEELEGVQVALNCGCGSEAANPTPMSAAGIMKVFERVKNTEQLRKIIDLAGRYIHVAQARQRQKLRHGLDDVVGIVPGGDVGRLTVGELALLADDEELGDDAIRRLLDNQAICREHRGVKKLGKGPIVVCIDESGSMGGQPVTEAKAFALAMAWVARHQRRWCILRSFSSGYATHGVALPPNKWNHDGLMNWLTRFQGGGASLHVPIEHVPFTEWPGFVAAGMPRGKTDLIVLTDAEVGADPRMRDRFNEWKKEEKCRMITLVIGAHHYGQMKEVSDEIYYTAGMSVKKDAVGRCLSV